MEGGVTQVLRPGFLLLVAAALAGAPADAAEHVTDGSLVRSLTLAESILLAVGNNQDLASGRLDRLAQKLSLEDAEDGLRPAPALDVFANRNLTSTALGRETVSTLGTSPRVTLRIPTGGQVSLGAQSSVTDTQDASQSVTLQFTQPLLKGAGTEVGTAGVATARRREQMGFLAFKSAVIEVVTRTVYAYRDVIRSMQAMDIAERSIERARDLLAVNRLLIETGRMAEQEIVQTEASIAERELSLTEARDALNDARLTLIDVLGVDSRTRILPTDPLRVDAAAHDAERSVEHRVELAIRSRPDYLQALLANENARTALRVADNAREWSLDFTASAKAGHRARTLSEAYRRFDDDYFAGLSLNIPLGTSGARNARAHERAGLSLEQSAIRLAELRRAIEIEVRRAVRDVDVRLRRTELARRARALSERKLEVERTKLNAGRSSNFRLVRFEDDLVRSQNNEIGAITAYLNALTALDRTQATTLETWGIEIDLAYDASGAQ